jgi:hypothetical protein
MFLITLALAALLVIAGCSGKDEVNGDGVANPTVRLYKSEQCGCCGLYGKFLDGEDYNLEIVQMDDVTPIKDQYKIPTNLRSCHTAEVGGYYVEGHMPKEAIDKLLAEKPDIAGIALAGMPSGSPGMPGGKSSTFVIYAVDKKGNVSEFMKI